MEKFLRQLRSLDASDFAQLARAHDATRRHRREPAYRTAREKLTRLDDGGAVGIMIREAVIEAIRASGYDGEQLPAITVSWWTGLAFAFRADLSDDEFAALTSVWHSVIPAAARRASDERMASAG
ncbi:MAG: hypothetical protein M3Y46_03440 [Actinomycetota bacterium]|jgi:hypothetical protein|nr:hypothetical protein [Actinomycetota bacterium]MDQ2697824.1 hypothetical protein [Actinomycetota bacterium]